MWNMRILAIDCLSSQAAWEHQRGQHTPLQHAGPVTLLLMHLSIKLSCMTSVNNNHEWVQTEQRKLREGAAAMAAELVTLRHHMALLTSTSPGPTPNGMPLRRTSPNGMGPPPSAHMPPDPADLLSAATSGSLGITKVRSGPAAMHDQLRHGGGAENMLQVAAFAR